MQDCILDEGNGLPRLMSIDEGRQELTIARPNEDYYYGFRIRQYVLMVGDETSVYLIASEDPLELSYAADLVSQLNPNPIATHSN
ncbi:hypothetical protein ACGKJM_000933 [Citrobacter farmeri]|nr:hypothetical protein [Enterobacter hormaechei]